MTTRRSFVLLAAALAACSKPGDDGALKPLPLQSIDITGATYANKLELPDIDGKPRTLAEFKGKAVIVFFGFAQCPDVCPAALAEIDEARRRLGVDGARVQPIFVTVDPERDTPEVLKAYVGSFGADIVALRGTLEQTQAAAKEFKVFFAKVPGKEPGSYTIDHTAGMFLFDREGRVRAFARYGAGVDPLVADLKLLLG